MYKSRMMSRHGAAFLKKILFAVLVILGLFLLSANILGLIQKNNVWPRPEEHYIKPSYKPFSQAVFEPWIKAGETGSDFAARMNKFVNEHTVHYYFDENTINNIDVMTAPLAWSWPLWACGLWAALTGNRFSVEFCDSGLGLERGYGYCSQRALILQDILRSNGFGARVVDLSGHVVCVFNDRGRDIVLDPDYGVVLPHSLEFVRDNPEILGQYLDAKSVAYVGPIYRAGNFGAGRRDEYDCFTRADILAISAFAWLVPLGLVLAGFLGLRGMRKNSK